MNHSSMESEIRLDEGTARMGMYEEELKRFTAEKAHVRKELRETQRGLDVEINRLDVWLKVLNIAVAPLAVALAGALILSLRRRRRASGGKPA